MKFTSHSRRHTAFTLVELLVVIGIIALLVSILLPTLSRARASASSVACQSNLRQVGLGLTIYAQDNGLSLPTADTLNGAGSGTWHPFWFDHVAAAVGVKADGDPTSGHDPDNYGDAFTCSEARVDGGWMHYSVHPRLIPSQAPWMPESTGGPSRLVGPDASPRLAMQPYKLTQIGRPTEVLLAADASQYIRDPSKSWLDDQVGNSYYILDRLNSSSIYWTNPKNQFTAIGDGFVVPTGFNIDGIVPQPDTPVKFQAGIANLDTQAWASGVRFRHFDESKANVVFVDGHVESKQLNEQSTLWPDQPDGGDLQQKNVMIYRK
jgi:prepilin-type processing-associated H-X9-DG protein/prepilin-type N-terminal cleavage/methylation domain-containing protein